MIDCLFAVDYNKSTLEGFMYCNNDGHEKLYKVILNKKQNIKFNLQELEEISFIIAKRIKSLKKTNASKSCTLFLKKIHNKFKSKIENY